MKKKTLIIVALSLVVVIAAAGATLAWFTSTTDPVTNVFGTGNVKIVLHDKLGDTDFPTAGIQNVVPGDSYPKKVSVTNQSTIPVYVRVQLVPQWKKGGVVVDGLSASVVKYSLDSANWIAGDNNWYYYKSILPAGTDPSMILSGVTFDGPSMDNTYAGATFTIDVKAEAVQASHYAFKDTWGIAGVAGTKGLIPAAGVEEWMPADVTP